MICPRCGTNNKEGSGFCITCGGVLNAVNSNPNPTPIQPQVQPQPVQQPQYNPQPSYQPSNNQNNSKKGNSKVILMAIVFIIIAIVGIILLVNGGKKSSGTNNGSNNNSNSNGSNNNTSEKKNTVECDVKGKHIHTSDLTEEDQKKNKIKVGKYGMSDIELYKDSKIKSITFNGKTYDYKEIVEATNNFDKLLDFVSNIAPYHNKLLSDKEENTKEVVKDSLTKTNNTTTNYPISVRETFSDNKEHNIKVDLEWPGEANKNKTLDTSYYGQVGSSSYIWLEVDLKPYTDTEAMKNENISLVLEDGRIVHLLFSCADLGRDDCMMLNYLEIRFKNYEEDNS